VEGPEVPGRPASAWNSADASPRQTLITEVLRSGKQDSFRTSNSPTTLHPATMLRRCCSWSTMPRDGRIQSRRSSTLLSAQQRSLRGDDSGAIAAEPLRLRVRHSRVAPAEAGGAESVARRLIESWFSCEPGLDAW